MTVKFEGLRTRGFSKDYRSIIALTARPDVSPSRRAEKYLEFV